MELVKEMPLKMAGHQIGADIFLFDNQFKKMYVNCFGLCPLVATELEKTLISLQNSYFLYNLT